MRAHVIALIIGLAVTTGAVARSARADELDEPSALAPQREMYTAAHKRRPSERPADPYAAIDGDRPREMKGARYQASTVPHDCSARKDHCLPPWVWFVESASVAEGNPTGRVASVCWFVHGGEEPIYCPGVTGDFTAYRTVPATKRMLAKGALVVAVRFPKQAPEHEGDAMGGWDIGIVDAVDWDGGKLTLVAHEQPYWISATRVAVLSWKPHGALTILGKRKREELAVKPEEVFTPRGDVKRTSDPMAEVGPDGKPRAVTDTAPLESSNTRKCDAEHDHCLRPWVWFIDDGYKTVAAMYKNGKMNRIWSISDVKPVDGQKMAYRTVPATPETLQVGQRVYFTETENSHEEDAMTRTDWAWGKVSEVQPEAGLFKVEKEEKFFKIRLARIAVVQWFPGDKAEKVEP